MWIEHETPVIALKGLIRKNERGYRWNLKISGVERFLSDVPVFKSWYITVSKLYQNVYMQDIRPYYVTRTPSNGRTVYWSRDPDGDWDCTVIGWSSGDMFRTH